ncbi:hypothetical protein [Microbacterium pygmaeum]|uniref:hypothetical protein n=1 Tax=Microbacterium pygmaeum TaxID=370764 RepID=UPI0012FCA893|nr:hypothetical protein [Microbacterium pygmaeum]
MEISITGNFDGALDDFKADVRAALLEEYAKALAERVREAGATTADDAEITIASDSNDPALYISPEDVRRRANQILGVRNGLPRRSGLPQSRGLLNSAALRRPGSSASD